MLDMLSSVRTCFFQAGLPELSWPDQALRFVRSENVQRRLLGTERGTVKMPFLPRLARTLDLFLQC